MKAIVELIGEFEAIDHNSLRRNEPVRVRVACKDPRELHFAIHVYINKVGYMIRWEPEGYPPYEDKHDPSDGGDDDGGKDDTNDDMNLDEDPRGKCPNRGRQSQEKRADKKSSFGAHSAPPTYKGKVQQRDYSPARPVKKIASKKQSLLSPKEFLPEENALVLWEEDKLNVQLEQELQELEIPLSRQLSQVREGPSRVEFSEDSCGSHHEELEMCDIPSLSDIVRLKEEEEVDEDNSFKEVSNKKKGKKGGEPTVTSRMSLRHRDLAAIPVPKRAEILTQKKNLESTGNSKPFAIFQLIDNEDLLKIASASHISLGKNRDEIDRNIDSIKAKELVQAKLSELRWKQEKERVDAQRVIDDAGCVIDQDETVVVPDGDENDGFSSPELKRRWGSKTKKKK